MIARHDDPERDGLSGQQTLAEHDQSDCDKPDGENDECI